MEQIEISGLYIIDDRYFSDYPNEKHMWNKEESRPHYYAIQDRDGIYWMIPMSTKVEKYRAKIRQTESVHGKGSCFMFHVAPIHGQERAILICDMLPVSKRYILRPYTIGGLPYIVKNENIKKAISTKAKRYLSMVKRGQIKSPLNIMQTKEKILMDESKKYANKAITNTTIINLILSILMSFLICK